MELKRSRARLISVLLAVGLITIAVLCVMSYRALKAESDARRLFAGAETASKIFHRRLADGDYESVWRSATPLFRRKNSPAQLSQDFKMVYASFGRCRAGKSIGGRTSTEGDVVAVSLVYDQQCAGGTIRETLTWQVSGGNYALGNILMTPHAK